MNIERTASATALACIPMDTAQPNESRASWGEAAIMIGDPDWGTNDLDASIQDAVANVCHGIRRMGRDPERLLRKGLASFREDSDPTAIGGGQPARRDIRRYADADAH